MPDGIGDGGEGGEGGEVERRDRLVVGGGKKVRCEVLAG
jgi:hypothetical protein